MKKRIIEISSGLEGVIRVGDYENLRPKFYIKETIEDYEGTDEDIVKRMRQLQEKCKDELTMAEQEAIVRRIARERAGLRFSIDPETKKLVPHITDIIGWDADFNVPANELEQYAAQGNITHKRVEEFIKTGEWKKAKEIPDCYPDIVIIAKGTLGLSLEYGDFPAFLQKYPITNMVNGSLIFNRELEVCGTLDFTGIPNFKDAESVPTVWDVKRTVDKVKHGMQVSFYAKTMDYKQAGLIPLNGKTEQGFSKPTILTSKDIEGFYAMVREKREAFKRRFGI